MKTDNMESSTRVKDLLSTILDCVGYPRKEVNFAACSVAGMILQLITTKCKTNSTATHGNQLMEDGKEIENILRYFHEKLLSKIESRFPLKDGVDIVAASVCAVAREYAYFLKWPMFLKMISFFRQLKPRGRYEFLQAVVDTENLAPEDVGNSTNSNQTKSR